MEIDINNRPLEQDNHISEEDAIMHGCLSAFILMAVFLLIVMFIVKLFS